jgi:hypothetical protein
MLIVVDCRSRSKKMLDSTLPIEEVKLTRPVSEEDVQVLPLLCELCLN